MMPIALTVADMDFKTAPEITDAIIKRAQEGIYGYTQARYPPLLSTV